MATRWLGVGLATALAVVTLGLALTGRLGLYINPDSAWFAVGMAVFLLVGAAASFALPLGAEEDHGHDHAAAPEGTAQLSRSSRKERSHRHFATAEWSWAGVAAAGIGGVLASVVVVATLVLPPAALSAELAMSRDVGAPPLFGGSDVVALATTGDTSHFGIGDWATVFATATNPGSFDGDPVELTGFVTPRDGGGFALTRLVVTHCVIDAQPASLPIAAPGAAPPTGQWVTVTGTVRADADGRLQIVPTDVAHVDEPGDPYEF